MKKQQKMGHKSCIKPANWKCETKENYGTSTKEEMQTSTAAALTAMLRR